MLHNTKGIVLRSVKYGDSSLVSTILTDMYGIQAYMVQGVRSSKPSKNRAGFFQPGTLLDMVVYRNANKSLQRIKEFQTAHLYQTVHEDVVKNSVVLFSAELLLRLLPEDAPQPELFELAYAYFVALDNTPQQDVGNFPLYFIIQCGKMMGYDLQGKYSTETPFLDLQDGSYSSHAPSTIHVIHDEDAKALSQLLDINDLAKVRDVEMNSGMRLRLMDWYVAFLQLHTQHMGNIRSLSVLRAVLH
jgi:DNA repair protein RecO (recombination protein O)